MKQNVNDEVYSENEIYDQDYKEQASILEKNSSFGNTLGRQE